MFFTLSTFHMYHTFTYMYFCFVTMSCICLSLINFCSVQNILSSVYKSSLIRDFADLHKVSEYDLLENANFVLINQFHV